MVIPIAIDGMVKLLTPEQCGKKLLGWWDRQCKTSWASKVRILVVGHPERMRRDDYVSRLVDWVRS